MRQLLAFTLQRDGFDVTAARDGAELLDWIGDLRLDPGRRPTVDLIITDIRMPALSGLDVLAELRWDSCAIPVIVITAFGDEETHGKARRLGAVAVFDKPFELHDIRAAALSYTRPTEPR